ncbi:MAG: hypothetical protein COB50_02915 [Thiotrichales bacterium]|nr:MAG: hypothetical protein COB50_02915 [Thiotrichales bacterium]
MLDLRYIGSLRLRYRVILLCMLVFVVIAWTYYVIIAPSFCARQQLQQDNLQLQQQYKLATAVQYDQKGQLRDFIVIKRKFSVAARSMVTKDAVNKIIAGITRYSKVKKLDCCLVQPLDIINQDFYSIRPVQFVLRGGYHQVGKLLAYIANIKQLVVVHSINLTTASQDVGRDLNTIELLLYVYTKK